MNKKSILYILVVLMTLSLTLSAVSADDVAADDDELAVTEEAPAVEEEPVGTDVILDENGAGEDCADCKNVETLQYCYAHVEGYDCNKLDDYDDVPYYIYKKCDAACHGVDYAELSLADASSKVPVADVSSAVKVLYETPYEIIWGVYATNNGPDTAYNTTVRIDGSDNLLLQGFLESVGKFCPIYFTWDVGDLLANQTAVLLLDTIKLDQGPYWVDALVVSDSFDPDLTNNFAIGWADVPEVSAAEKTMPAAGNPIAMALLALVTIAGTAFTRRF